MKRRLTEALCLSFACLLLGTGFAAQAVAVEDPYQFNAKASLIGGCGTSVVDEVEDPGCPGGTHPPKKFTRPTAIATDPFGNEYVASYGTASNASEGRIDIFDAKGNFITEILDPSGVFSLAIDSEGNLYTASRREGANHEIAVYQPTEYEGALGKIKYGARQVISADSSLKYGIAVDLGTDRLLVNQNNFISEYSSLAEEDPPKLLGTITHPRLVASYSLAVDAARRLLYASACPDGDINDCWVIVLDADTHELVEEITGDNTPAGEFLSNKGWLALAVDEKDGSFFVGDLELTENVYKFALGGEYLSTTNLKTAVPSEGFSTNPPQQIAVSNAPEGTANHRFLYVPSLPKKTTSGHAFAFEPPSILPPKILAVSVGSIGETEAELQAQIEPKGGVTTYKFEYLTQQAFEEAGNSFAGATVAREGSVPPAPQKANITAPVSGLAPGTAYRFRVVIENAKGKAEAESAFATYDDAPIGPGPCANQEFRTAFSAALPDCRAYELVTPADTNGRPPRGVRFGGDRFKTLQASPSGNAVSFTTEGGALPGLGGAGALNGDLYRSTRGTGGWGTVSAGPSGPEATQPSAGSPSPDQGYAFWTADGEGSAVLEGEATSYIHYPDGHSELVGRGSEGVEPRAGGILISEGGTHVIFETRPINGKQPVRLEPNASTGKRVIYDRIKNLSAPGGEETKVVSLLPGGATPSAAAEILYVGASADGEGIAFTIDSTLYLRVHNEETFAIGSGLTFAGVSEGGERIFYVEEGDLKAFDASLGAAGEEIAFTDAGTPGTPVTPVNVSPDGSRAYFVFNNTIPGAGSNPEGKFAKAGQPNLFLSEAGEISFVATVTERDVKGEKRADGFSDGLGLWTIAVGPGLLSKDPSRSTTDGAVLLFQSRAEITGYPAAAVPQIYRYDSTGEERLHCISCIPTGQPSTGGASLQSTAPTQDSLEPFGGYGFVPNFAAGGKRVLFQSTEALVSRDSNGVQDVYEWEEQGVGSCNESGGCVYLITSGHSTKENYLFGHSSSGDDVFFLTADVLVGGDDDTLSIYDARVGGGFPEAVEEECKGEGCRPVLTPAPPLSEPAKPALGADDQVAAKPKKCPKGKKKVKRGGKVVCVKKKKKQNKKNRKAGKNGKGASK